MYESFYGFKEKPFTLLPDPGFLFLTKKHRMALTMLQYGLMNEVGCTVITGEIGAGKTTLIREVLNGIGDTVTVGVVSNTHRSFGELLKWVLIAFKLEFRGKDKVELHQTLTEFLAHEYNQNHRTVLIIDEAQNLIPEAHEELRMLTNTNVDKDQMLQLILVGQPSLRETLRQPDLHPVAQRVAVDYHLQTLDLEETWQYIRHRVTVAGGEPSLFDTKACAAVYYYTKGTPRVINVLCDTALMSGFAEQKPRISADLICEVARQKALGGILPVRQEGEDKGARVVHDIRAAKKEPRDTSL